MCVIESQCEQDSASRTGKWQKSFGQMYEGGHTCVQKGEKQKDYIRREGSQLYESR